MEIGDLVKQRTSGVAIISEVIKQILSLNLVGMVIDVMKGTNHSYDGIPRDVLVIYWSNGKQDKIPEIYLKKL